MDVSPHDVLTARLAAGLTQAQAAAVVGLTPLAWQHWERGVRRVSVAHYRLFLHLTGLEAIPFGGYVGLCSSSEAEPAAPKAA